MDVTRTLAMLCLVAVAGCCGGGEEFVAELDSALGLETGSPVMVAGLEVGEVTGVKLAGDVAQVTFRVDREHDLQLHADACALSWPVGEQAPLVVIPGEIGDQDGDVIPPCTFTEEDLATLARDLGEGLGTALRNFGEGVVAGTQDKTGADDDGGNAAGSSPREKIVEGAQGLGELVGEAGAAMDEGFDQGRLARDQPACDAVQVRISTVEEITTGAFRYGLEFTNAGATDMEVGALVGARFRTTGGQLLEPDRRIGGWFMPFVVPSAGSTTTYVEFTGRGAAPALDVLEVERSSPADRPLAWCTIRQEGLSVSN